MPELPLLVQAGRAGKERANGGKSGEGRMNYERGVGLSVEARATSARSVVYILGAAYRFYGADSRAGCANFRFSLGSAGAAFRKHADASRLRISSGPGEVPALREASERITNGS